jgi:hypothetical protein
MDSGIRRFIQIVTSPIPHADTSRFMQVKSYLGAFFRKLGAFRW